MRFLLNWLRRRTQERELADEITANLQIHIEDNIRAGMNPDEARRQALLKFGGIDAAIEQVRDARGISALETLARDLRYAGRSMAQNKTWTAIIVLSLAFGLSINTAFFSVAYSTLAGKLPVPKPDELVYLWWDGANDVSPDIADYEPTPVEDFGKTRNHGTSFSLQTFKAFQSANRTLTDTCAIAIGAGTLLSGGCYQTLGVQPAAGRLISPTDDTRSAPPVVVISYAYWERKFDRSPNAIGSSLPIDGRLYTVIGVTPKDFRNPLGLEWRVFDFTMPLTSALPKSDPPSNWWVLVMGRRKPDVSLQEVRANFQDVFRRAATEEWQTYLSQLTPTQRAAGKFDSRTRMPRLDVAPGGSGFFAPARRHVNGMILVAVIFGIVLLVVCVNIANLMLTRAMTRQREMAVRLAIGATRRDLMRQMLTECLLLATIGGSLGLFVAHWWIALIRAFTPLSGSIFDWHVLGFAWALSLVTAVSFGLTPALRASRGDASLALRKGTGLFSRSRSLLSRRLIIGQVALSLVLLTTAGLFLRTLRNVRNIDPGFNADHLALFTVDLKLDPTLKLDGPGVVAYYDRILEAMSQIPGVQSASFSDRPLLGGNMHIGSVSVFSRGTVRAGQTGWLTVGPGFFETMQIPIKSGKPLPRGHRTSKPRQVVVNEAFVRDFFPDTNPIGQTWGSTREPDTFEIVAVAGDARFLMLTQAAPPTVYLSLADFPSRSMDFELRTAIDAGAMKASIRDVMRRINPGLPAPDITTYKERIEETQISERRVMTSVLSLFGAIALLISMTGLFGLASYTVSQRTKEIGIRMALGADRRTIVRAATGEILLLAAVGVVLGSVLALGLTHFLSEVLYGLSPYDPITILITGSLTLAVSALASYLPARRAARTDPLVALRHE